MSYAYIALLPSLTKKGRMLLAARVTMVMAEAAAGLLPNPFSSQEVLHILGVPSAADIPGFELLLETRALDGTSNSA